MQPGVPVTWGEDGACPVGQERLRLPGRAAVSPLGLKATAGGRWGPEVTHPAPAPATPGSRTESGRNHPHFTWGQLAREGRGGVPEKSPHARPHPGRQAGPSSRQAGWGRAPRGGGGVQPPGQAQRWAHPVPVPSAGSCPRPSQPSGLGGCRQRPRNWTPWPPNLQWEPEEGGPGGQSPNGRPAVPPSGLAGGS